MSGQPTMHVLALASLLLLSGCGDDGGTGAGGGATSSQTSAAATGSTGITTGVGAATSSSTGSAAGAGGGDGSCAAPFDISLPFEVLDVSSSSGSDDVASNCEPVPMPEVVFRIALASEHTVTIAADAPTSDGISLEIRAEDCAGRLVGCVWQADGGIEQVMTLPAGAWVFIVQRSPAGTFAFRVTE